MAEETTNTQEYDLSKLSDEPSTSVEGYDLSKLSDQSTSAIDDRTFLETVALAYSEGLMLEYEAGERNRLGAPDAPQISSWDLVKKGLDKSVVGAAVHQDITRLAPNEEEIAKIAPEERALSEEELLKLPQWKRQLHNLTTLGADLPLMAIGATIGTLGGAPTGPGAVITGAAGAFALPEGLRAMYIYKLRHGEVQNFEQFWDELSTSVKATAKGWGIGAATGVTGVGVTKVMGEAAFTPLVKAVAEGTTMVGTGAAFEGRVPGWQDFLDAAIMLGAMHVSMKAGAKGVAYIRNERVSVNDKNINIITNKIADIYNKTGITPEQIMMDVKKDPKLLEELMSTTDELPTQYRKQMNENRAKIDENLKALETEITARHEKADALEADAKAGKNVDQSFEMLGIEKKKIEELENNYYYELGKNSRPIGSITEIKGRSNDVDKALNAFRDLYADELAALALGRPPVVEGQTVLFGSEGKTWDAKKKMETDFNALNRLQMFYLGQLEQVRLNPSKFEFKYLKDNEFYSVAADDAVQAAKRIAEKEKMSPQEVEDKIVIYDVVKSPTLDMTYGRLMNRLASMDVFEFPKDIRAELAKYSAPEPLNVIQRTQKWINDHTRKIHEFEFLGTDPRYTALKYELRKFQKGFNLAADKAANSLNDVVRGLSTEEYKIFNDIAALKYIKEVYNHELAKNEAKGISKDPALPFGIKTIEQVNVELDRLINASNQKVLDSLERRKAVFGSLESDHRKAMESIGVKLADNYNYNTIFRDRVIRATQIAGESGKGGTRSDKEKGIGKNAYYTDYIYLENKVLSQIFNDIQTANFIAFMKEHISDPRKQVAVIKAKNEADKLAVQVGIGNKELIRESKDPNAWQKFIEDGDTTWTPQKGDKFYVDGSLTGSDYTHIVKELFNLKTDAEARKFLVENPDIISGLDQNKNILDGADARTFVLPKEVAETLKKIESISDPELVGKALVKMTSTWKKWVLYNPYSVIKYNLRNLTGDADIVFAGNPHGFLYLPEAMRDIHNYYKSIASDTLKKMPGYWLGKGEISQNFKDWIDRGGNITLLQAQEIEALNRISVQFGEKGISDAPIIKQWWKTTRLGTDARESWLRFANYLDYLKSMEADITAGGQGVPRNFGASKERDVMALKDIKDRAFMLSNDLLGPYDRVSEYGQSLRKYIYPFWSFPEINFRRYKQLIENAVKNPQFARAEGERLMAKYEKLVRLTPMVGIRLGIASLKISALTMMASYINNVIWGEEDENGLTLEDKLPVDVKKRPHIIVGQDDEGNPYYFTRIGALGDLLEWAGVQNAPDLIVKRATGKISEEQFVNEFFGKFTPEGEIDRNVVNIFKKSIDSIGKKVINDIVPLEKIGIGALLDYETYPEIKTVREPVFALSIAKSLGLSREYKHISNLLTEEKYPLSEKSWGEWATQKVIYKSNTFETAYFDNIQAKNKFLKDIGKSSSASRYSDTGNALYNAKLAMRFGDEDLTDLYIQKYFELGGTSEGMESALKAMDPLANLSDKEKGAYINSLDEDGRIRLMMAYEFYGSLLSGQGTKKVGD